MNILSYTKTLKITALVLTLVFLFSLPPQNIKTAGALIPFGGKIAFIWYYCNMSGGNIVLQGNFHTTPILSSHPAAMSFSYGPPKNPGQSILGKATAYHPCVFSCGWFACPYPSGPAVLFNGSTPV